ncbi:cell division protein FtsZ [Oceanospirillum linum]|uniref:Cell division protein FtsZ n=1 Tax=Oceanospirillum linum TaxID=966 RepID=A0A1T1HF37_OCELI|nr:cell division protein FtsZ [Oceanospirillum linum]OOV88422.1 cell division protein FtsZ [Oceanospirillum linum]SEF55686.1 cell division protein FtsZ [Oleiphilus messinensis]SMP05313.1 cell division protein FtsZ [Oceanospirillum linum]
MFEILDNAANANAVIKVVGVGGGGGNAVTHMLRHNVEGVDFIVANTDAQALKKVEAKSILQLGSELTKGLGAGANPEVGRQAALEDRERIAELLNGSDMVFIAAGMGGGTGTGGAPVIAEVARELGILTVAVVTKPFPFEGRKRMAIADQGIQALSEHVDSLITIPNEKLLTALGKNTSLLQAFGEANNVLLGAVQGIADLITRPGMINVDFADVRTVMSEKGMAMMGTGTSSGENRAIEATEKAIRSPLLEDIDLRDARGILVNISAGSDFSIGEFTAVGDLLDEFSSEHSTVVIGTSIDPEMDSNDEVKVTVVAAGLEQDRATQAPKPVATTTAATKPQTSAAPVDYTKLDRQPAINRKEQDAAAVKKQAENKSDMDYLDIPAFLRRQAD